MASYPQCQFSIGFHSSHFAFMKYYTGDDYIEIFGDISNDVLLLSKVDQHPIIDDTAIKIFMPSQSCYD